MEALALIWFASALCLGAFAFLVVKPRVREVLAVADKERKKIWDLMDAVCESQVRLRLLGNATATAQAAYSELGGSVTLESLERRADFSKVGVELMSLEVEIGSLEAEMELVRKRHGRAFYHVLLGSTIGAGRQICTNARSAKAQLLSCSQPALSRS